MEQKTWYGKTIEVIQPPPTPPRGERPMRPDKFLWVAFGLVGVFLLAQLLLLVCLDLFN